MDGAGLFGDVVVGDEYSRVQAIAEVTYRAIRVGADADGFDAAIQTAPRSITRSKPLIVPGP